MDMTFIQDKFGLDDMVDGAFEMGMRTQVRLSPEGLCMTVLSESPEGTSVQTVPARDLHRDGGQAIYRALRAIHEGGIA